jgi:hypothetical protein
MRVVFAIGAGLLVMCLSSGAYPAQMEGNASNPNVRGVAVAHYYSVYYRCASHGWRRYGCYDCLGTAQQAAQWLQSHGYQVTVVCD